MDIPRKRVVASLTTLPGRYDKLRESLKSLRAQTVPWDAIYLGLPKYAARLKQSYPPLPEDIAALCTIVPMEKDYGPVTKIAAGLLMEDDPNTVVVTFDDDIMYHERTLEWLLEKHKVSPDEAISAGSILLGSGLLFHAVNMPHDPKRDWLGWMTQFVGFKVPPEGRRVDIHCGIASVLYIRKFFPMDRDGVEKFLALPSTLNPPGLTYEGLFYNDDVYISGYISSRGVARRHHDGMPLYAQKLAPKGVVLGQDGNELSFDKLRFLSRFIKATDEARGLGLFADLEPAAYSESLAGRVFTTVFLLVVVILVIICILLPPCTVKYSGSK